MIFRGAVATLYLSSRHTRHRHILSAETQDESVSVDTDNRETHPAQQGEDGGRP